MPRRFKTGTTCKTTKNYPRVTAGPLRYQYIHRIVAAAMLGRDLKKDEEVHHRDGDERNFHFSNLVIRGQKDHGWISAKQAWYMKEQDGKLKEVWEKFIKEEDERQHRDIYDRLKAITAMIEELHKARLLEKEKDYPFGREIWEMDTLQELHRLLYEV